MRGFKTKLTELICGTNADQTSVLIKASRRPGKYILSYFHRLKSLYLYCTKKSESDLDNDKMGLNMFYQKIADTLPQIAKIDFVSMCEESMGDKNFTFDKLKRFTVQAARKAPRCTSMIMQVDNSQHMQESDRIVHHEPGMDSTGPEPTKVIGALNRSICWNCHQPGHIARHCWKRQKDDILWQQPEKGYEQEEQDEYRGESDDPEY